MFTMICYKTKIWIPYDHKYLQQMKRSGLDTHIRKWSFLSLIDFNKIRHNMNDLIKL